MLLERLIMKNFKRFRSQEIHFKDGITGIVGNNGSGKSTIVEAILFSLYGLQGTGIGKEFILSSFAGPKDECEVSLDFRIGGQAYRIIRTYRQGSTPPKARIYMGTKLLADTTTNVAIEVERITGMAASDLKNTVYAGQKDLLSLIESRTGERKNWFTRALGIDYLRDESMALIREQLDEANSEQGLLLGKLEELDPASIDTRLLECAGALTDLAPRLVSLREDHHKTEASRVAHEQHLSTLREAEKSHLARLQQRESLGREVRIRATSHDGMVRELKELEARKAEYDASAPQRLEYQEGKDQLTVMGRVREIYTKLWNEHQQLHAAVKSQREQLVRIEGQLKSQDEAARRITELEPPLLEREQCITRLAECQQKQAQFHVLKTESARLDEQDRSLAAQMKSVGETIVTLKRHEKELATLNYVPELISRKQLEKKNMDIARDHDRQRETWLMQAKGGDENASALYLRIQVLKSEITEAGDPEATLSTVRKEREDESRKVGELTSTLERTEQEQIKLKHDRETVRNAGADGKCPLCNQPLGNHYGEIEKEYKVRKAALDTTLNETNAALSQIAAGKEQADNRTGLLERQIKDLHGKKEQCMSLLHQYETVRSQAEEWCVQAGKEQEFIEALGLTRYDAAIHETLNREINGLEESAKRIAHLKGLVSELQVKREERNRFLALTEENASSRAKVKEHLIGLGYDERQAELLEQERKSLEPVWREFHTLTERLRTREQNQKEKEAISDRIAVSLQAQEALTVTIDALTFREDDYLTLQSNVQAGEPFYRRSLELEAMITRIPDITTKERSDAMLLASTEEQQKALEMEITRNPFDESAMHEASERMTTLMEQVSVCAMEIVRHEERQIQLLQEEKKLIEQKTRSEEYTRQYQSLSEKIHYLKLTGTVLRDYVIYLMQVIRGRIETEVSRILGEITSGRYDQVIIDEDFNLFVRDIDADYPVERFSGGEQDDIAVALRIALSRYLAEFHQLHESTFLVFDEIFGSQDEERRNNLIAALRTQEAYFPQIILISHIPEIQGEFSNTLLVECGPDQVSRVQEVST
jgi:DNA repair exonuclease SbcCD ATPase subunit